MRLRGGEPRVEPGKKPRDPFISISRRSRQVIQCVCVSLSASSVFVSLCLSVPLQLSLRLSGPGSLVFTIFCVSFLFPKPPPPALIGLSLCASDFLSPFLYVSVSHCC